MSKFAVIDLGSNSVRMSIIENGLMTENLRKTARLSESMGEEKTLKEIPINRTLKVVEKFAKIIETNHIDNVIAIATAAVRQAKNPQDIVEPIKKMGIDLRVISGDEEAHLDFLGVKCATKLRDFILVDTGGASTEIILCKNGEKVGVTSIPYGAVNIMEGMLTGEKVSYEECAKIVEIMCKEFDKIDFLTEAKKLPIIAIGGTARAAGKYEIARKKLDESALEGYEIDGTSFLKFADKMFTSTLKQREKMEGISKNRASLICGGLMPVYSLFSYVQSVGLHISTKSLRDGVICYISEQEKEKE